MKTLLIAAFFLGLAASSYADIQDPPSNDYGPTRKLGRGVSNFLFAPAEVPVTIARVNRDEGNAAAAGYGVVLGLGRSFLRGGSGLFEILTFPVPVVHGTYAPVLPGTVHRVHGAYSEFPPELGNESKYPYVRDY